MSELFAGGVPNLDIWRPESAELLPRNDNVAFSIREKRETAGAPVSGSSRSPELRVLLPHSPFVPGTFMSGQQQPDIPYAASWGVLGAIWTSQSDLCSVAQLAPMGN